MLQKNWETTVCCFSREVVELKLSVCHSISWTPLSCADFPVLLWDYPVALLSLFLFLSFKPASARFAPFYHGHCVSGKPYVQHLSGFCWSKREGNNQRWRLIPAAVPKTAHIPTPPPFIFPGRLRADLRSAERLAAMIFGDLSPAQWTCQSSSWV